MKLMENVSFQCFTGISNYMHVTKLASLGWISPYELLMSLRTAVNGLLSRQANPRTLTATEQPKHLKTYASTLKDKANG